MLFGKNIKQTFFILIFCGFHSASAAESSKLTLPKILSDNTVVLGETVDSKIKTKFPDFTILSLGAFSKSSVEISGQHPMAIVSDFNGDEYRDIVIYGVSKSKNKALILGAISNPAQKTYDIYEIHSHILDKTAIRNNPSYLTVGLKSKLRGAKRDTAQFETFAPGVATALGFYFSTKENKFKPFQGKMD